MAKAQNLNRKPPAAGRLQLRDVMEALIDEGFLAADKRQLIPTITASREAVEKHPLALIAERGWRNERDPEHTLGLELLCEWLAARVDLPHERIDPLKIDVNSVTAVMSYAYAARFNILALDVKPSHVVIATADPCVTEWQQELEGVVHKEIHRVIASPVEIERYLLEFYALARSVQRASPKESDGGTQLQNLEQLMELGRAGGLDANDHHVVSIVDWLLQYAMEQRASDIHLEPRRNQSTVRFRIDGVLHPVYEIPTPVMAGVISRIKILGRMDVAEKRRPQDGRLKTRTPQGKEVELRLSSMPTAFGEKVVMRIFNPDVLVKDLAALGFTAAQADQWKEMIHSQNGIVLLTGPTGSGKTTTLYSSLKHLATSEVNVSTIEDPIELLNPAFNQMQVQSNIGLSFAAGVRTLLRQDPDIIMIGEIRDHETAEMAAQAAQTGHLVLSTLHTNDAPSAITRLLDLGVAPYLISASMVGVVAQRLVRTLCPHCKEAVRPDPDAWNALIKPWNAPAPARLYRAVGCLECRGTGYRGRTGIYEILPVTGEVRKLIRPNAEVRPIRDAGLKQGMRMLRLAGAQKIADGLTTIEEVVRVTPPATND